MSQKLKPCPFCGGRPQIVEIAPRLYRPSMNHRYCVVCWECNLLFGYDTDYGCQFDSEQEAAELWNRRAEVKGDE